MLLAFGAAFSNLNVLARSIDLARRRKKGFVWWYFIGGFAADAQIWRETKGIRWLVILGTALCFVSYIIYRVYVAKA